MKESVITPIIARLIAIEGASGKSIRFISNKFSISKSRIGRDIQSTRNPKKSVHCLRTRPRKITKSVDKYIYLPAKRRRFKSYLELATEFNLSLFTIRRRLREKT